MKLSMIEWLVIAIIIALVIISGISNVQNSHGATYGVNGLVETRCINGYSFTVGERGNTSQILDENGHGIKCQ